MKDISVLINNNVDVNTGIKNNKNEELYNQALRYFLKEIDSKVEKLKKYLESAHNNISDIENYSLMAETLKNDSKNLGFNLLADLAYKHEINAKTKDLEYITKNFNYLTNEVNTVVNVLKTYLNNDLPNNEQKKILVVDDSNLVRNLIKKMINNDYEIITANDGKEAIDTLSTVKKELVGMLLDLNMPNVNGFQVLEYLKQNNLFEKIKVAIITGDDSKETVLKAFNYPIVDVLAKPFNESDVKRVVTAMITHK